jgi:hypothetical protein
VTSEILRPFGAKVPQIHDEIRSDEPESFDDDSAHQRVAILDGELMMMLVAPLLQVSFLAGN